MRRSITAAALTTLLAMAAWMTPSAATALPILPGPQITVVNLLEATQVDVYVEGVKEHDNVSVTESVMVELAAHTDQEVVIAAEDSTSSADALMDPVVINLPLGARGTLAAYRDDEEVISSALFPLDEGPVAEGWAHVAIQNASPFGPIDVWVDGVPRASGVAVGEQATLVVEATGGTHEVRIAPAGVGIGGTTINIGALPLAEGDARLIQVFGGGDAWVLATQLDSIAVVPVVFADIDGNLFEDQITWLGGEEISTGWDNGDGTADYRPLSSINRDAMAAFLYRFAGSPEFTPPAVSPFVDVAPTQQFYKEMAWLAEKEISTGWPDGTFRPLQPIARDAMAAFLYRYVDPSGIVGAPSFTDVSSDNQFYGEIAWLAWTGISTGWPDGTFRPLEPINRDAMAAFLYRLEILLST